MKINYFLNFIHLFNLNENELECKAFFAHIKLFEFKGIIRLINISFSYIYFILFDF
jgi:hypothetical protein